MRTIHLKRNPLAITFRVILLLFLLDTIFALANLTVLIVVPATYYQDAIAILWVLHSSKYVLEAILITDILITWLSITYTLEDHQLTITSGVLSVQEQTYRLDQLKAAKVQQSWFGRLVQYGTIRLELIPSGGTKIIELDDIQQPHRAEHAITASVLDLPAS